MTRETTASRRSALKVIGVGTAASLAGCTGILGGGGSGKFEKKIETARQAGAKYDGKPKKAVEDGFTIRGGYEAGAGSTFTHLERRNSHTSVDKIDLSKPSFMTVDKEGNVGAVGYHGPMADLPQSPSLFPDEKAEATEKWRSHKKGSHFAAKPDGKKTDMTVDEMMDPAYWATFHPQRPVSEGDKVTGEWGPNKKKGERIIDHLVQHPGILSLFVWTQVENPDGIFAGSNSKFAQG